MSDNVTKVLGAVLFLTHTLYMDTRHIHVHSLYTEVENDRAESFSVVFCFSVESEDDVMANITSSHTSADHHDDVGASSSESTATATAADSDGGHSESNLATMKPVTQSAGQLLDSYSTASDEDRRGTRDTNCQSLVDILTASVVSQIPVSILHFVYFCGIRR